MKHLLSQLDSLLRTRDLSILEYFNPGIEGIIIDNYIDKFNITLPEDVKILYDWRNGLHDTNERRIGEMTIFGNGIFLSIQDAVEVYENGGANNTFWDRRYFPLFTSGGGDFLLIDIDNTSEYYGMILLFSPVLLFGGKPQTIYDSLGKLLKTVVECYEQRAYYFENGMLETDYSLKSKISKLNNPKSDYWKDDNID